jgi:hypothetical protein
VEQLRALAAAPESVTDAMLLSAERFVAARKYAPVDAGTRAALISRFGLVGLRWTLRELREDPALTDRDALARRLSEVSGLDGVRALLDTQIQGRADVLKADAAVRLLARAAAETRIDAGDLLARAERLRLGVHDFAELELLNDLRTGRVEVAEARREALERLLGSHGSGVRRRLDLPDTAPADLVRARLLAEHGRWRAQAADPLSSREELRTAAVAQRTCEGMLALLG